MRRGSGCSELEVFIIEINSSYHPHTGHRLLRSTWTRRDAPKLVLRLILLSHGCQTFRLFSAGRHIHIASDEVHVHGVCLCLIRTRYVADHTDSARGSATRGHRRAWWREWRDTTAAVAVLAPAGVFQLVVPRACITLLVAKTLIKMPTLVWLPALRSPPCAAG